MLAADEVKVRSTAPVDVAEGIKERRKKKLKERNAKYGRLFFCACICLLIVTLVKHTFDWYLVQRKRKDHSGFKSRFK